MDLLPDGDYAVIVLDAEQLDATTTRVDLTLLDGAQKGHVISLRATGIAHDATSLLGLPGTLRVVEGMPRLQIEK